MCGPFFLHPKKKSSRLESTLFPSLSGKIMIPLIIHEGLTSFKIVFKINFEDWLLGVIIFKNKNFGSDVTFFFFVYLSTIRITSNVELSSKGRNFFSTLKEIQRESLRNSNFLFLHHHQLRISNITSSFKTRIIARYELRSRS